MHKTARPADRSSGRKGQCFEAGLDGLRHNAWLGHALQRHLAQQEFGALDEWIDDAIDTELTAIMRFASVLRRDIDAVKNAIELPWSNGQAEGQINRLKMLKRAMYGRAGPELMRARMLPLNHRN